MRCQPNWTLRWVASCVPSIGSSRRRNQVEYPHADAPAARADEVERDVPKVEEIIVVAAKVLDEMSPL
ncbi:methyl coenzyme M reductase subunit C-like uncharacterized protein (methanogenesis marker protein 7) [Actinoplanes tereljensis]|uniref:Uncharacterized protein n=1 Tax=Paractinoplanes tereljensis TaxID=571912 RepID=A0A919TSV2_9ACTN|nr:hypothetical protein Ate02nite_33440 [Actinoplanes tereljensis]